MYTLTTLVTDRRSSRHHTFTTDANTVGLIAFFKFKFSEYTDVMCKSYTYTRKQKEILLIV